MRRLHVIVTTLSIAAGVSGCRLGMPETAMCDSAMPSPDKLLAAQELEPLKYYTRINYQVARGAGFDIWADSKFEYGAALQYSIVPRRGTVDGGQYCANAVTLRLAWPLDEVHRKMLTAFVVGAASQTTINRPDLQASLALEIANGEKYHAVARQGAVSVEAGRLSHPNRGDFFAIAFLWHAR